MYHDAEPTNIAFLHDKLQLGGSIHVSFQTTSQFNDYNINSHFFVRDIDNNTIAVQDSLYNVEILPKGKLLSEEQIDFMIDKIQKHNIKILFIATNLRKLPVRIKEQTNCKIIYWLHSTPFWEAITKDFKRKSAYRLYPKRFLYPLVKPIIKVQYLSSLQKRKRIYLNILRDCDAYIVLCEEYKKDLLKNLPQATQYKSKIHTVINTIKIAENIPTDKKKEIIFMGRLSFNDKRVDRVVRIWNKIYKKLPDWQVKIYGVGEEEENLQTLIKKLHVERLSLQGYTSKIEDVYRSSSILCLTSNFEGVPLCMIEAQNYGVVPIAFNCVAGIDYVIGKKSGIAIPPYNEEMYANALLKLCADENYLKEFQTECLKKRLEYTTKANNRTWRNIFKLIDKPFIRIK